MSKIPDRVWLSADRQWAKSQTPICTEEYVRAALRSDPAEGRWTIGRTDLRSYTADGRRVQYLYPPEEEGQRIPFYGEDCVERAQLVCGLLNVLSAPAPASSGGERLRDIGDGWLRVEGVTCVACPDCAFTFDAAHEDEPDGGYSCPCCEDGRAVTASRIPEDAVPGTIYRRDGPTSEHDRVTDLQVRCSGDVGTAMLPDQVFLLPRTPDDTGAGE